MHPSARLFALAALATTTAACHPMQMEVAPALSDDRMSVSRDGIFNGGDLHFGEFTATDIDRGWTRSQSTRVMDREETSARQRYRFTMVAGGAQTDRVRCETVYAETARHYGSLRIDNGRHGLGCVVADASGRPRGELVMAEADRHRPSGQMVLGRVLLDLVPTARAEGARWEGAEAIGYELRVDGHVIAAVQTINGGAVWIERDVPDELRDAAAVAAATLLLYETIDA